MLQTLPRLDYLDRIHVKCTDMPLSLQPFQHPARVTAIAERGIQPFLPRLYLQKVQYLIDHDGPVHPRRRAALADHLLDRVRVFFRVVLLVLFLKFSGMRSLVAHAPFVLLFHITPFCSLLPAALSPINVVQASQIALSILNQIDKSPYLILPHNLKIFQPVCNQAQGCFMKASKRHHLL